MEESEQEGGKSGAKVGKTSLIAPSYLAFTSVPLIAAGIMLGLAQPTEGKWYLEVQVKGVCFVLLAATSLSCILPARTFGDQPATRPNVVIILADDMGF